MEGLYKKIIYSKSKTFLAFCFSFMFGAATASFADTSQLFFAVFVVAVTSIFFTVLLWPRPVYRFSFLCLLFAAAGVLRFLITFPPTTSGAFRSYNGRPLVMEGYVSAEPAVSIGETQYVLTVQKITENKNTHDVQGKVVFKNRSYPAFEYGDRLSVRCAMKEPFVSEDSTFRYDKYLAHQGIWSVCQNPYVTKVEGKGGNLLLRSILGFKQRVNQRLTELWTEPHASFMAGLLYGSKSGLPQSLTDAFSRTGVSHIIAVSGFNITIIGTVLGALFLTLGFSRQKAFWWILGIIFLFVVFSGASSSVVRAGIMGSLVLVARQLGRMSRIGNVLVFTAAFMTLLNPYVLVWDVGFQLSFLATIGLVYVSPILQSVILSAAKDPLEKNNYLIKGILHFVQNDKAQPFLETLVQTLSAIIATLPLILFQFGRLSIVAPLVNVLVLWIIPWLMLLGFLALILSLVYFPVGQAVAWLAAVGLKYVILVVSFFGSKTWSALDIPLPWWGMGVLYLGLGFTVVRYETKNKNPQF